MSIDLVAVDNNGKRKHLKLVFMFGDQDGLAPAEYPKNQDNATNAVKIVVPDAMLTGPVALSKNVSVRVDLFDYKHYTTLTNAKGTGNI